MARYDSAQMKRARTMAIRAGLIVSEARTVEAAPVKAAKLPVWALAPKARQARYDSQPTYWVKPASAKQRDRITDAGGKLPAKATAKAAAELYAKLMQEAHGMTFKPLA